MSDTSSAAGSAQPTRRQFGQAVAGAAAGVFAAPAIVRGRNLNEKLNIAVIGVGGRGGSNLRDVGSENIVALCDVSEPAIDQRGDVTIRLPAASATSASSTTAPASSTRWS